MYTYNVTKRPYGIEQLEVTLVDPPERQLVAVITGHTSIKAAVNLKMLDRLTEILKTTRHLAPIELTYIQLLDHSESGAIPLGQPGNMPRTHIPES